MKDFFLRNIKNIPGWSTKRKLVIFSVDDYGNVRLNSRQAKEQLEKSGIIEKRFDRYDALETREDLEQLYEVLSSVKDKNGKPAVFTPYTIPCNIDFETVASSGYNEYHYELLTDTFNRLEADQPKAYRGAWSLWKQGIAENLMEPQFHGREHINLNIFRKKLAEKDKYLLLALENQSFIYIPDEDYNGVSITAAFNFKNIGEIKEFPGIIRSGIDAFEKVFSNKPTVFTPPAMHFPMSLEGCLKEVGLKAIDQPFNPVLIFKGEEAKPTITQLVRNVVFEPQHDKKNDWVGSAIKQVQAAFFWNKPAHISSHRVNFGGHIDEHNRQQGLAALKELLQRIVKRWPDVEFISASQLADLMINSKKVERV